MPLFEFKCSDCGCTFEELTKADAKPSCPKCGSGSTEKLMSVCVHSGRNGNDAGAWSGSSSGGGGCGGCSGGNCASCGR